MVALARSGVLVRSLSPARTALREGRLGVASTVLLAASAIALLAATQALRATQPAMAPLGVASSLVSWTADASPPAATQAAAIRLLLETLLAIAWTTMALAMVTVLIRFQVKSIRRGSEVGIRRAVGASRADILLALLLEGSVTATLAVAAGTAAGALLLALARAFWPGASLSRMPLVAMAAVIALGVILLGALSPLRFLRARHMRDQEEGEVPLGLPTFQLAISLAIVMGSALLLGKARHVDAAAMGGRDATGVIVQLDSGLTEHADRSAAYGRLLERVRRAGPAAEVSLTAPGGLVGLGTVDNVTTHCGQCVSGGIFIPYHHTEAVHLFVSPDSFMARGARVVAGRALTSDDTWGRKRVAVVNRHLALRHFEGGNAVGRNMWLGADLRREPYEVIGIVDDAPSSVLGGALQPRKAVYLSVLQLPPREGELLIRSSLPVDTAAVAAAIHDTIGAGHMRGITTERDYGAAQAAPLSWFGGWFGVAGLVVLLTGVAGTFSTVRWWVDSLAAELSLRRAVGASRFRIAGFVLSRAMGIGIGGVALGLFLFFVIVRGSLTALVPGLPIWNQTVFSVSAALFGGIALVAAALPTLALLRRPPMQTD